MPMCRLRLWQRVADRDKSDGVHQHEVNTDHESHRGLINWPQVASESMKGFLLSRTCPKPAATVSLSSLQAGFYSWVFARAFLFAGPKPLHESGRRSGGGGDDYSPPGLPANRPRFTTS